MASFQNTHGAFAALKPVQRVSKVEHITEELSRLILSGTLKPGEEMLSQSELARLFSVSLTVIREVMGRLKAQGLVEVSQGQRTRVKQSDTSAVVDAIGLFLKREQITTDHLDQVRAALEGEIAALAAQVATPDDIELLKHDILQIQKAHSVDKKVDADVMFHRHLAGLTGNPVFILLIDTLIVHLRASQREKYIAVGSARRTDPHIAIYDAILSGNCNEARTAMIDHLTAR